ncbi:hypothetical protein FS749_003513 [Ceratobasidium sp. UAMH 11750]|nr:hypothetical protein FS749_003513 [Ceratobasidium sp. UAMH 11750]
MTKQYLEVYPFSVTRMHIPEIKTPVISYKQHEVLQDIVAVLSILHHTRELLSAERTPTLALALPVYKTLIQPLTDCIGKFPELQYVIECGTSENSGLILPRLETFLFTPWLW